MSLPKPIPGLVIRYGFLWSTEADRGFVEPSKYRPCVIVVSVKNVDNGRVRVRVAPITHTPKNPEAGIEIPRKLARHLGLDDDASWISIQEMNEFVWPGVDLRPVKKATKGEWSYGVLPADFFEALRERIRLAVGRKNTLRI